MTSALKTAAVAPLLQSWMGQYRETLDIVERPSVGSLVAPEEVCFLMGAALRRTLSACHEVRSLRVWVRCSRTTPTRLLLEIVSEGVWPGGSSALLRCELATLNPQVRALGGELTVHDGADESEASAGMRVRLEIPIEQHPAAAS